MRDAVFFKDIISGLKMQYRVPIWQRLYAWEQKDWMDLWEDLLKVYNVQDSSNSLKHYLGAIVFKVTDERAGGMTRRIIIDGQQRITTLILALVAVRDRARVSENSDDARLARTIEDNYLFNKDTRNSEDKFRLILTRSDNEDFKSVANGNRPTDAETSNIFKAYSFFTYQINAMGASLNLDELVNVISGLEFTSVSLEQSDDPNRIFETLNYRGKDLTQSDLVRNLFMMSIRDTNSANEAYENFWFPMEDELGTNNKKRRDNLEGFIGHYINLKMKTTVKYENIYPEIKKFLENKADTEVKEELKTLKAYADLYQLIIYPDRERNEAIRNSLQNIGRLDMTVHYPFLLKAYKAHRDEKLSVSDFISIMQVIESYAVRRYFLKEPPNSLNKLFASLCEIDDGELLSSFTNALTSRDSGDNLYWPSDEKFKEAFIVYPVYNKKRWLSKLVLDELEKSFSHPEPILLEDLTIEHVMPRTLDDKWKNYLGEDWKETYDEYCHTIGNLTLIGSVPNSAIQQELLETKKEEWYKYSNVELTKEINGTWSEWTKDQMIERGRLLAERAAQIWKRPSEVKSTESSRVVT